MSSFREPAFVRCLKGGTSVNFAQLVATKRIVGLDKATAKKKWQSEFAAQDPGLVAFDAFAFQNLAFLHQGYGWRIRVCLSTNSAVKDDRLQVMIEGVQSKAEQLRDPIETGKVKTPSIKTR